MGGGAVYAGSLGELDSIGLSGSEIRFHGKTLLALVAKAQALPDEALPEPLLNLMDMPGYRKAFKAIKALVQEVAAESKVSAELLASRRQINQLLNAHWKLKPQNGTPELMAGWRGETDGRSPERLAGRVSAIIALCNPRRRQAGRGYKRWAGQITCRPAIALNYERDSSASGRVTFSSRIEISPSFCSSCTVTISGSICTYLQITSRISLRSCGR
ncbi:Ribonuclease D [Leclercia adecarboxylata]|uniref:Ribonuclease D n=1 Tax=Leclercia adecarboxylata TaxID=83655 RepID=A0A4U9I2I1_9ENTR|nr:Ribonuclease D [Leclercia adecarboxylata]